LWIETDPSAQQAIKNLPLLSYFRDFNGLLNYENSSTTSVVSVSNILIFPDSNPQANIGYVGWDEMQRG
jgi:hypothetical protein